MSFDIKEVYESAGQGHLFKYWSSLSSEQQLKFLKQLEKFPEPAKFIKDVKDAIEFSSNITNNKEYTQLPDTSFSTKISSDPETVQDWENAGLKLIEEGKVGIILMAGGQGTRLGSTSPKGCYDVGLPSHKSLFQLQVERILKLELIANGKLHLYIMTSGPTREATENFFHKHNYFGWEKERITFFDQGTLPAVTLNGERLLLGEDRCSLIESPDGNGGLYKALFDHKILDDFIAKGIEHIHMYCVDNVLVKVGDPTFIGYSVLNDFDIATKVVRKNEADEKVGLIVLEKTENVPCVIEYSEISKELSEAKDENDPSLLKLRAANIVNHYYKVDFLQKMVPKWIGSRSYLPYHIAKKKINCFDTDSEQIIQPSEPNGIKMEQFIFDVFPSVKLEKIGCLEVAREDEFSPVKNAPGAASDSPEIAREKCLKRSTKWIVDNGGLLDPTNALVEVSPLTSYSGEGLSTVKGKVFTDLTIV